MHLNARSNPTGIQFSDGCIPVNDTVWGLHWPGTTLNSTYVLPCPQGRINNVSGDLKCLHDLICIQFLSHDTGMAYRFCSSTGVWGLTNVTLCESYIIRYLAQEVQERLIWVHCGVKLLNRCSWSPTRKITFGVIISYCQPFTIFDNTHLGNLIQLTRCSHF